MSVCECECVCVCVCVCVCFLREHTKGIVWGCWLFGRHLTVHSTRNAQFSLHGILSLLYYCKL